jgi:hypothetical protein
MMKIGICGDLRRPKFGDFRSKSGFEVARAAKSPLYFVAAITGRRSSTRSFTRRPMIAASAQTKAASGNLGGFFYPLPGVILLGALAPLARFTYCPPASS